MSSTSHPTSRNFENILVSSPAPAVTLITLNRPKALNAINAQLMNELVTALEDADRNIEVGAVVLTGSERAFAAGADIKEMKDKTYSEAYSTDFLSNWTSISSFRKPLIAAVSGYALGGGCELALMSDILLCSSTAKFGQPEINIGVIPGGGGTQRLARVIGKSKTMELVLTGRQFSAEEAEKWGLASKVVDKQQGGKDVVEEAVEMAKEICAKGRLSVIAGKEAVNKAYELSLKEGLDIERRLFHGLFATKDQKEGMVAFVEKRKANFTNE